MNSAGTSEYIYECHFHSANDFLQAFSPAGKLYSLLSDDFIFRGQARDDFKLLPNLLRDCHYDLLAKGIPCDEKSYLNVSLNEYIRCLLEYRLIKEFYNRCNAHGLWLPSVRGLQKHSMDEYDIINLLQNGCKWLPFELWEITALAQHYGLPTRLLDWTTDLYVAAYFAAEGGLKDLSKPMFSSVEEQLNAMHNAIRTKQVPHKQEMNIEIWALNKRVVYAFNESPIPLKIIQPRYFGNPNLQSQKGALTLWQIDISPMPEDPKEFLLADKTPLDQQIVKYLSTCKSEITKPILYRFTLPQKESVNLLMHLNKYGYSEASIFPGYRSIANEIKNQPAL